MFFRFNQRFTTLSFITLLLISTASVNFIYLVSPLRDPKFEPNSGNAGSLVPWLQHMSEGDWFTIATILSILLSTNLTIIFYQFSATTWLEGKRFALFAAFTKTSQHSSFKAYRMMRFAICLGMWFLSTISFWAAFMIYLMCQWLID